MIARRWSVRIAALALTWACSATGLAAQEPARPLIPTEPPPPLSVSPRGAMIRAMLVPGWGHAAIGAYGRGGFYVALESLTAYTFLRTRNRLGDARDRVAFRESFLRSSLAAEGVTDAEVIETRLEEDGVLGGLRDLVSSRERQQEDIVAFGIFVLFLAGADAFVSAHLARFPEPIDIEASGTPDTGMEIRLSVPVGF